MNLTIFSEIIGAIAVLLLFCLMFYISITPTTFNKVGRTVMLWSAIYVFFLFFLRIILLLNLATTSQLRILSSFAAVIPLLFTLIQLFLNRKIK